MHVHDVDQINQTKQLPGRLSLVYSLNCAKYLDVDVTWEPSKIVNKHKNSKQAGSPD